MRTKKETITITTDPNRDEERVESKANLDNFHTLELFKNNRNTAR